MRIPQVVRTTYSLLALASPYILAAVLLMAVVAKIRGLERFTEITSTLRFIPPTIRNVLPLLVPLAELVAACFLLLPDSRRFGLYLSICVLMVFTIFLLIQAFRPYAPSCNCFGLWKLAKDARTETHLGLLRNAILIALATAGVTMRTISTGRREDADPTEDRTAHSLASES